jgi:radical SAM-linked protein
LIAGNAVNQIQYRKIRIYFEKVGDARFLSHLDVMRTMERALRRAELPVRFTEGMHPKVRMSFPTALPLGMASGVEVMEVQLPPELTVREVRDRLAAELPEGLKPWGGNALYGGEKWSVIELQYEIRPANGDLPTREQLDELLARESIPALRRGKEVDLRPLLGTMDHDGTRIRLGITWTDTGTARPEDFLRAIGCAEDAVSVVKVGVRFRSSLNEEVEKTNVPNDPHQ